MENNNFRAFWVTETENGFKREIINRKISDLPDNDVLIKVYYSGLNFKDALSASGNKGVTKKYPHTPGIDCAGIVIEDRTGKFKPNTEVLVTGYDLGMNTDGGFGEYVRVPADWVVALPSNLTLQESMMIGTAGFTAALGVYKMLLAEQMPENGPIVVTGGTGGVASIAIQILKKEGFEVWASSRKQSDDYLNKLGVDKIIPFDDVNDTTGKPILRPRWAGAFDTVGGNILNTLVKACDKLGSVATCGNVAGMNLELTVFPFILNGVNLLGINSADARMDMRLKIWEKLSTKWKPNILADVIQEIGLDKLDNAIDNMLKGNSKGRILLKHSL